MFVQQKLFAIRSVVNLNVIEYITKVKWFAASGIKPRGFTPSNYKLIIQSLCFGSISPN